ncbi:MAG TPA: flippase [Opitutaceae bacterium]|jgi:O-antigen/teichoic acid export membrane protein|nr:flippase [Opitutaceae bacterium]
MSEAASTIPVPAAAALRPKAARNVFWLIAERGLKAVGGVAMAILIARHLGPEHYGSYGAAIGLATLAKEAVMLGFDRMIRRDLAANPSNAGRIIGTSIGLSLILALAVGFGISGLSGQLIDDSETRRLVLIMVWMCVPQAFFSCEVWFESSGHVRQLVWTRNVVWILGMTCRLVLVLIGAGVTSFAAAALLEWIFTYAAVFGLLQRMRIRDVRFSFDSQLLRAWFREGWPMVAMVVVGSTADRIMVLVVHNMATSDKEAGYLNAALRITEIWWSISTIVAAVLLPRIVAIQRSDPDWYARVTQLYANASLLVGVGAAALVTVTAPFIVPLVFGPAYAPSAKILAILFWAGPAIFPAVARAQFWVSRKMLILDLPSVSCIAALQLCLAVYLVPRYGGIGAASAMAIAQWLGFYGLTMSIPALRRASRPQFKAFIALLSPVVTARALYAFFAGMLRKG